MKIGICGAQSTGKSTLARALSDRLGLPLIAEQARVVARGMGIYSEEMLRRSTPEMQRDFQRACLEMQQRAESQHESFVSDRTVVDNAAYWLAWNHNHANLYLRLDYLSTCKWHAESYDLIVYCPPTGDEPEDDGFRIPNQIYQAEIDFFIGTLLLGWELHFVRVEGTTEERVEQVMSVLEASARRR